MLARPPLQVKTQLQSREGSQSQGRHRPVPEELPYRLLLQAQRRNQYSPKKNLETETTLSRLNKRLSSYETDITVRLMSGKARHM